MTSGSPGFVEAVFMFAPISRTVMTSAAENVKDHWRADVVASAACQ
jgi:hypothetical protein